MAIKKLMFDPADPKVRYINKFIAKKDRRHPMRMPKLQGPYWYAYFLDDEMNFITQYLGRDLPPEVEPYVKDKTIATHYRQRLVAEVEQEWTLEPLNQMLDKNGRVFIDIPKIAADCMAYYDEVGPNRYVVYRT